jgi:alkylation response protein AidB-like acyl-CoA dehydrogenase
MEEPLREEMNIEHPTVIFLMEVFAMDFSLDYTQEQEAFAVEVRKWLDENVPKDLIPVRDTKKMSTEQWTMRREFARRLGQKGWLYPAYPPEYGGGGLDPNRIQVLIEELAARDFALPPLYDMGILASPAILAFGTEEQKNRILPPIFKGEVLTWQLFTEPGAGTDAANQQTDALRSKRKKDVFIINGQKIFIGSFPSSPEQLYVLTRSDPDAPRHKNLSSFVIPADLPGITVLPLDLFPLSTFPAACGPTGANLEAVKHSVFFDNVEVPDSYLIGEEGQGWEVTMATLAVEHSGSRGGYVRKNYMAESFLKLCRTHPMVIRRIHDNPELMDSVVQIYMSTQIERLFTMRNVGGKGEGYGGPHLSLFSKMFGTTFTPHASRVLGPYVYTDDPEWMLDDGHFEVGQRSGICLAPGGTPEAYKIGISRALRIGR